MLLLQKPLNLKAKNEEQLQKNQQKQLLIKIWNRQRERISKYKRAAYDTIIVKLKEIKLIITTYNKTYPKKLYNIKQNHQF